MKAERLLQSDPVLYVDLLELLRRGDCEIRWDSETALLLKLQGHPVWLLAATEPSEAERLLALIPSDHVLTMRGCDALPELAERRGFNGRNPCWQAAYLHTEPLQVQTVLEIRNPESADFEIVRQTYEMVDEEELREDFEREDFLCAYLDGKPVGYVGTHSEGSMGLLFVLPTYRRRGFAEALYSTLVNRQLEKGRIPYAQIIVGNEPSLALQRKLGFTISKQQVFWVWKKTE